MFNKRSVLIIAVVIGLLAVSAFVVGAQGPWGRQNADTPCPGMGANGPEWSMLAVAAEQLGLEPEALLAEINAGKTIAQVAEEKGVELDVIVEAFIAAHNERFTAALESGRITQEQLDAMNARMREHVTAHLNGDYSVGGMGMMGRGGMHHGGMGMMGRGGMGMGMGGMGRGGMGRGGMGMGGYNGQCPLLETTPEAGS